jgi:hypothetical protein
MRIQEQYGSRWCGMGLQGASHTAVAQGAALTAGANLAPLRRIKWAHTRRRAQLPPVGTAIHFRKTLPGAMARDGFRARPSPTKTPLVSNYLLQNTAQTRVQATILGRVRSAHLQPT